jgi:hypothetical protein
MGKFFRRFATRALIAVSAGAIIAGGGAIAAQAASYRTSSTLFLQEQSQWCWAAATKTVVKHNGAGTESQCQLVKWGFNSSTCPNKPGTAANVASAMIRAGQRSTGRIDGYAITYAQVQSDIHLDRQIMFRWGWSDGSGHMLVMVGYNTPGSQITFIDPTQSSYQTNSYNWIKSASGHTWTNTRWQIIPN